MNPDLIKQFVFLVVRWFLPPFITWATIHFNVTADQANAFIVGAVTYAVMFVWGLFNKIHAETKINTALDLPKGTDKDTLKEVIANGDGTSATAVK